MRALWCAVYWGASRTLSFGRLQTIGMARTQGKAKGDSMNIYIIDRPMYRIFISIEDGVPEVDIALTAKGKRYAVARGRGFHHVVRDDEDALAEIFHARDTYFPIQRPEHALEKKF